MWAVLGARGGPAGLSLLYVVREGRVALEYVGCCVELGTRECGG